MLVASSIPGYGFGLPGTICRLPDLACPLAGRPAVALRSRFVSVAASVPMDMMDSDLPCLCPLVLLPTTPFGGAGDLRSPVEEGVLSERAGRCPRRRGGGGFWDAYDEFRDTEGRVDECTGGSLRCRSPPGASPFCLRAGERSRPSGRATFLKVIVHSTSSPANTVAFFHCTNTRIFEEDMVWREDGAGCGIVGSSSRTFVKRHGACRIWTT
jgi:hypothetical protein